MPWLSGAAAPGCPARSYRWAGARVVREAAERVMRRRGRLFLAWLTALPMPQPERPARRATAPRSRLEGCGGVPRASDGSSRGRGAGPLPTSPQTCSAASAAVSHRRFLGLEPGGCPARRGRTASIHRSDSSDARAICAERRALHKHSAHPSTPARRPRPRGRDAVDASRRWARAAAKGGRTSRASTPRVPAP